MTDMHSCSYYCDRPDCIKRQRDELREALFVSKAAPAGEVAMPTPSTMVFGDRSEFRFFTRFDVRAYGDARAAAAVADVPDGWVLMKRVLSDEMSLEAQMQVAGVDHEMLSEIWEAFLRTAAAPQPGCLDCAYNPGCCDTHD